MQGLGAPRTSCLASQQRRKDDKAEETGRGAPRGTEGGQVPRQTQYGDAPRQGVPPHTPTSPLGLGPYTQRTQISNFGLPPPHCGFSSFPNSSEATSSPSPSLTPHRTMAHHAISLAHAWPPSQISQTALQISQLPFLASVFHLGIHPTALQDVKYTDPLSARVESQPCLDATGGHTVGMVDSTGPRCHQTPAF